MSKRGTQGGNAVVPSRRGVIAASFEGPLPPPDMLEHYNNVVPGAAERILAMAEKNGDHRRALETYVIRAEHRRSMTGTLVGGVVALAIIICGTIVTLEGYPEVGLTMVALDIAGIAGSFVYGTESRRRERIKRAEIMTGRT